MNDQPVSDLKAMLAGMQPVLDGQSYRFFSAGSLAGSAPMDESIFAIIREDEGTTIVARAGRSDERTPFARITLMVHSSLEGVGLTAAVSDALAAAGIACNVIAGLHHDHLFVPWERREEALDLLKALSDTAQG